MDEIFCALSYPARREMPHRFADDSATVSAPAAPHDMTLAATSRHIKIVEHADLNRREVLWRRHICRLTPAPLSLAYHEIDSFVTSRTEQLDTLERPLCEEDAAAKNATPTPRATTKPNRMKI